jgi:hypothetical protein
MDKKESQARPEPPIELVVHGKTYRGGFYELVEQARTLTDSERTGMCSALLVSLIRLIELKVPIDVQKRVDAVLTVLGPEPESLAQGASPSVTELVNDLMNRIVHGGTLS